MTTARHDETTTRTVVALVVVAVVVLATFVVTTTLRHDDDTTSGPSTSPSSEPTTRTDSLDDLPQGPSPTVPYLLDGELHVDDLTVGADLNRLLSAGDTVLVGRTNGHDAHWWILDGGSLAPAPDLDGVHTPVLSPRGDLAAWTTYPDSRTTRIVGWRPDARSEVAHTDLDAPYAECCGGGQLVELLGFDTADRLFLTDRGDDLEWDPGGGGAPRPAARVPDPLTDRTRVWSSDGRLTAIGHWVSDSTTGTRTDLALPEGVTAEPVAFEADQSVLVEMVAGPRHHDLVRCSVADGSCERTLPPGTRGWVLPERPGS